MVQSNWSTFCQRRIWKVQLWPYFIHQTGDGDKILIVSLYVDDLIFTGIDESLFVKFKNSMKL